MDRRETNKKKKKKTNCTTFTFIYKVYSSELSSLLFFQGVFCSTKEGYNQSCSRKSELLRNGESKFRASVPGVWSCFPED